MTWVLAAALGWGGGMAVNLLADSLPFRRWPARPRCRACGAPRRPSAWSGIFERVRGDSRCRFCGAPRGRRPWLVEALAAGFAVWLVLRWPEPFVYLPGLLVGLVFLLLAVIDVEHRLILRVVVLPAGLVLGGISALQPMRGPTKTMLGGLAGFGIVWAMYLLGVAFSRWVGRRRGAPLDEVAFGFGDVMLGGLIGLVVGWPGVIIAIVTGVLLAGVFSIGYLLVMWIRRRYHAFMAIPYGPFLLLGASLVYFGGRTALEALVR